MRPDAAPPAAPSRSHPENDRLWHLLPCQARSKRVSFREECVAELAAWSSAGVLARVGFSVGWPSLNALAPTPDATRRLRHALGGRWRTSTNELSEPPQVLRRGCQHLVPGAAQASQS